MRELIKQAPTVEEAIELALKELGLTRGQVTCEVLEYPERKFLFMKKPAKVKVCEIEEEFSVKDLFEEAKPKAEKPAKQEKKAEKPAKPAKKEKQEQPKAEPVKETKPQVKEEVKEVKAEETAEAVTEAETNLEEISAENYPAKVKYSMEFISSVIDQFYTGSYTYSVYKTQTGFIIKILGDDAGCLIGRKGETMEALSYLTSLAANRFEDSDEKISVDVADYRQKREKDLQQLAKKMAAKVAKSGRSYSFEPMNPYERRIIHATVSEMEGVKSESKGEGSQRRVVIYSTTPRKQSGNNRKGGKPQGKGGRNDRRRDRKEKPAPQVQKTREEKLVDDFGGTGLYGKIEL